MRLSWFGAEPVDALIYLERKDGGPVVAGTMDQFIRPILIRRGADLPMLLILAGVIGGLIAFGVLGIFIGPTVLAVTYTLYAPECLDGGQRRSRATN